MLINREWRCLAHGDFEAKTEDDETARCPRGCNTAIRVFLTPQSIRSSNRTRFIDDALSKLAKDYGFTDMSNRNGDSVVHNLAAQSKLDLSPIWRQMPQNAQAEAATLGQSQDPRDRIAGAALGGGDFGGSGLAPEQFQKPKAQIDERFKFGDAQMLRGALAEGQKANQP